MADETNDNVITDRINQVDLQVEMQRSYLDYAMSVIVGRALPDVREVSSRCIAVSSTRCTTADIAPIKRSRNALVLLAT